MMCTCATDEVYVKFMVITHAIDKMYGEHVPQIKCIMIIFATVKCVVITCADNEMRNR